MESAVFAAGPSRRSTTIPGMPARLTWTAWLSWSLAAGLGLALARLALIFAIDRHAHGVVAPLALWRLEAALPEVLARAGGAAALAVALFAVLPRALFGLAACGLCAGVLAGWPGGRAAWTPGWTTDLGRAAWAGIAAAALVATLALWIVLARSAARPAAWSRTLFLAALWIALPLGAGRFVPRPRVELAETVLDLLSSVEPLVLDSHPERRPFVGTLCPTEDFRRAGGDRPSLVMPPPCEVTLRVPDAGGGELRVRIAAGMDRALASLRPPPGSRFDFEVLVDGRTEAMAMGRFDPENAEWWSLGDEQGVAVRAGSELRLRTALVGRDGAITSEAPLPIGFSGLRLERRLERDCERASPDAPAIVLIVMDTLRADRLGTYGCERPLSPNVDALAARGTVFLAAHATSSWTWPSTASLLTGLAPEAHGVTSDRSCHLDPALFTLAEALSGRGYATAAFSGSPLIVPEKGFDQGFASFDSARGEFRKSEKVVPQALDWMAAHVGQRFFLYLHLVDTHYPHRPLDEHRARFAGSAPEGLEADAFLTYSARLTADDGSHGGLVPDAAAVVPDAHRDWFRGLYDACVATGDHWVGRVLERIAALGIEDEVLVAFTSEHGEDLLDHGFLGHGETLYSEVVRVPLILAGPGVAAGRRVDAPVSNRHLAPTLAGRAGVVWPAAGSLDLAGDANPGSRDVFFSTACGWWRGAEPRTLFGVRRGDWTLVWAPESEERLAAPGDALLFDLSADPAQRSDASGAEGGRVDSLVQLVRRRVQADLASRPRASYAAGEETRRMLRELGYVGGDGD